MGVLWQNTLRAIYSLRVNAVLLRVLARRLWVRNKCVKNHTLNIGRQVRQGHTLTYNLKAGVRILLQLQSSYLHICMLMLLKPTLHVYNLLVLILKAVIKINTK